MKLIATEYFMKNGIKERLFGSYALLVNVNGEEKIITSPDVDNETYFDIASMGKVLVTSTLILKAIDEGRLTLDDTLDIFFDAVPDVKKTITVKELLTHTSGIVRYTIPKEVLIHNNDYIAKDIISKPLAYKPGSNYIYSCTGYILLGFILEKIYNLTLDELFYTKTKLDLGLTRSRFNISIDEPNSAMCTRRGLIPTTMIDDEIVVNMRGSVAGNGGEFWGLCDIKKFVTAIVEKNEKLYSEKLFNLAETDYTPNYDEGRGLGYLVVDGRYKQTGKLFPKGSFGHCGHCGQSFFISREKNMYVILLTNATRFAAMKNDFKHYDYGITMKMREDVHNAIYMDLTEEEVLK